MQGAGSGRKVSLANCTTTSMGAIDGDKEWDNLESIIRNNAYTVAKTAAYRQGLGVDFSRLRPVGTSVLNSSNESSGSLHWMKFIDSIGYFVGQKGRIPAMLFSLNCSHPDVEAFIQVKSDYTQIQNANISVQCTDAFYKAVENNDDWELEFEIPEVKIGDKVYIDEHSTSIDSQKDDIGWYYIAQQDRPYEKITKTVKAKGLMELIAKNMCAHGEPGIQNIDVARRLSNSDYVADDEYGYDSKIVSTNACSEQYLSRESLCVLASLNAQRFSVDLEDYDSEMAVISRSMNRFLDNVNECEIRYHTYATPHQRIAIEALRRTGAGYTNLAGWLFKVGEVYGSEKGNKAVEEFTKSFNYHLYASSIEIGHEKGSFGMFNREKFEKSPFVQRMMKEGLEFSAMRNVTLSSIAPTGSLSLLFRRSVMSYGIEPAFGLYFWKRTRISGEYKYYFCVPAIVRDVFRDAGFEIPINSDTISDTWDGEHGRPVAEFIDKHLPDIGLEFKNATDIDPMDKLDMMARAMKWIDSSISVTYLLPEGSDWKQVYKFIMEGNKRGVKSIAAFPDKKMYGIVSFIPFKEAAVRLIELGATVHHQNFSAEELNELNLTKDEIVTKTTEAPKRPAELPAEIYSITVKGEKFVVAVGLMNGVPYEVFGGHMNGFNIKKKHMEGKITKVSRGKYALEFGDIIIEDFSQQFTPVEAMTFRYISLMLRHGIPVQHVIEQSKKADEDMMSMNAALCRVLKKYIADGQKVSGKGCPSCSGDLIYHDGCVSCGSCDYTACN